MENGRPVVIFDFDNTLFDNDSLKSGIDIELRMMIGKKRAERFWEFYSDVRKAQGVVDYPRTAERWAREFKDSPSNLIDFLRNRDFTKYIYAGAVNAVKYASTFGTPIIVSDGDASFQVHKIHSCKPLVEAVEQRIIVCPKKDKHLDELAKQYPAPYFIAVDDKRSVLHSYRVRLPTMVTVHVNQGHYSSEIMHNFEPDFKLQTIGSFAQVPLKRVEEIGQTRIKEAEAARAASTKG